MNFYFECHITISPQFDEQLSKAETLAKNYNFKIANLLMQKRKEDTPERSKYDTFMTGHDSNYNSLEKRMIELIKTLKSNNFTIYRYKIESILLDSRIEDKLKLL